MAKIIGSNIVGGVGNLVFAAITIMGKSGRCRLKPAVIQLPAGIGTINGIYLFLGSEERKLYSSDMYLGVNIVGIY